ncbi:conjugative transposon protein TraM [Carboxylicivirga sp. RSCT41]|uniref:conjugative transposon protein TraM n=1 Tax=Carboxylicivirga agarovorans TaxID=3417570 RepID=UPI003D329FFE
MKTQIKKYKALFILPLGLLPFIVLIFYILGGASGEKSEAVKNDLVGVNYQLPDANRDIAILDKQEAYRQIKEDEPLEPIDIEVDTAQALTLLELTENLPEEHTNEVLMAHVKKQEQLSRKALKLQAQDEATRKATIERGELSDNTINKNSHGRQSSGSYARNVGNKSHETRETSSREKLRYVRQNSYQSDIELDELTELVDAHEQLMRQNDSLSRQLSKPSVATHPKQAKRESFDVQLKTTQGFEQASFQAKSIKAEVVQDTKVLTGNRVMLRLINNTRVNGIDINKGTLVYGLCKTDNERLQLLITSIPHQDDYIPVNLSAYDLDGIKGLYVPHNVNRKVYKDVASGVNPSVLFSASDDPLSYMGVNAAANLSKTVVKRVKLKRVYLRKNSVLILKNE